MYPIGIKFQFKVLGKGFGEEPFVSKGTHKDFCIHNLLTMGTLNKQYIF